MSSNIDHIWPGGIPRVGQVAERSRTVNTKDIERFTGISGDRNPLHYDEAVAKASRFGEIVVQGGVTSAILNAVVAEDLPGPGTVFLQVNWSFKAPVRPGDTITGRAEVSRCEPTNPSRSSRPASPETMERSSSTGTRCATRCRSRKARTSPRVRDHRRTGVLLCLSCQNGNYFRGDDSATDR